MGLKKQTQTFAVRFPVSLMAWLGDEAERRRTTVAQIIRDAVERARADATDRDRLAALETRLTTRLNTATEELIAAVAAGLEGVPDHTAQAVWRLADQRMQQRAKTAAKRA